MDAEKDTSKELINCVADLEEEKTITLVKERLQANDDPLSIVYDCQEGMRLVGDRYGEGRYYIAGLIMAGEILRQVMEIVSPALQQTNHEKPASGTIVLGTVKEDIHDLGKNIVKMLLSCHGFTVYDLGVDVPPDKFVEETVKLKPDIIGLSGLITAAYDSMKVTIDLLKQATADWPQKPYIIIGGSQLDQQVSSLVGTDYWVTEADAGVTLCKKMITEHM